MKIQECIDRHPLFMELHRIPHTPCTPMPQGEQLLIWEFDLDLEKPVELCPYYSPCKGTQYFFWEIKTSQGSVQLAQIGLKTAKANNQGDNLISHAIDLFRIPEGKHKFELRLRSNCKLNPQFAGWSFSKNAPPLPLEPLLPPMNTLILSQMEQNFNKKEHICSATSVTMIYSHLKKNAFIDPEYWTPFFQSAHQMYGIWPQALWAISLQKICGALYYNPPLQILQKHLLDFGPIAVSIAFGEGELTGSALKKTSGHFVVLKGWDQKKAYVLDPAHPSDKVDTQYPLEEFWKAWTNHGGMTYFLWNPQIEDNDETCTSFTTR